MTIEEIKLKVIQNKESENFIFNSTQEITDKEIIFNLKRLEDHLQKVNNFFKFPKFSKKINYYYTSKEIIESYAGNNKTTGRANLDKNSVLSIYPFHPHEITHVIIFLNLGRSHPLLEEGLAVLFGRNRDSKALWKDKPIEYWIEELREKDNFPDIDKLVNNFEKFDQDISYPVSAYYVKNIIDKIGIEEFKNLFKVKDVIEKIKAFIVSD